MKILGGYLKGRNFYLPQGVRATQNIIRKALFDILGQELDPVEFLELFAGSGSVGLEAVSRGARKVTFVDHDAHCIKVIEENINLLGINGNQRTEIPYELINLDAFAAIKHFGRKGKKFDIIFVDPPYDLGLAKKTLKLLTSYDILQPNCFLILQHEKHETLPSAEGRVLLIKQRKYGSSYLSIYQKSPE